MAIVIYFWAKFGDMDLLFSMLFILYFYSMSLCAQNLPFFCKMQIINTHDEGKVVFRELSADSISKTGNLNLDLSRSQRQIYIYWEKFLSASLFWLSLSLRKIPTRPTLHRAHGVRGKFLKFICLERNRHAIRPSTKCFIKN